MKVNSVYSANTKAHGANYLYTQPWEMLLEMSSILVRTVHVLFTSDRTILNSDPHIRVNTTGKYHQIC